MDFSKLLQNIRPIKAIQDAIYNWGLQNPSQAATVLRVGQPIANTIKNPPRFNFSQDLTSGIQNPYLRGGAQIALGLPESILNAPSDYVGGIARTGVDVSNILTGRQRVTPQQVLGDIAPIASSILTVGTLGAGKTIADQLGKQTLKKSILEGGLTGAGYGGAFGGLGAMETGKDISNPEDYFKNLLAGVAVGAGTGGLIGGVMPVVGKGLTKGAELYKASPLADQTGKVNLGADVVTKVPKPKGMTAAQFQAEMEANIGKPIEQRAGFGIAPTAETASIARQRANKLKVSQLLTGKLPQDTEAMYRDLVNSHKAADPEGAIAKSKFTALDSQGQKAILDFQKGNRSGLLGDVQKYFDAKLKQINSAGIDVGRKINYLPQLWVEPQEVVDQVLGRSVGLRPSFSMKSVLKDYETGIKKGLTPRFNTISDLVGWYESTANKAIANKQFFDKAITQGLVMPSGKAPRGWVTLNPDRFPKYEVKLPREGKTYSGIYSAPPELAAKINGFLEPGSTVLSTPAQAVSRVKNVVLSSGIPGTGWNAHGFNILFRNMMANRNPISAAITGIHWLTNPNAAKADLEKNLTDAIPLVKAGMTLSSEEHAFTRVKEPMVGNLLQKGAGKFSEAQKKLFEDPLFNKILPALKTKYALSMKDQLIKEGMAEQDALRSAAKSANNFFGGINYEDMGRNKDFQNALRILVLAPDWAETNFVRIPAGLIKGNTYKFFDPAYKPYRQFTRNMVATYVTANVLNKAISGHYMFQNDKGNEFNLDTGTYTADGQKRYIKLFGTAADFARIPFQVIQGLASGDPSAVAKAIKYRFSTPLATAGELIFNQDYMGNPIYGKDKYGRPYTPLQNVLGVGSSLARGTMPQAVSAGLQYAQGTQNLEQAAMKTLEMPLSYSGGAFTTAENKIADNLQQGGATGQDIYNTIKARRDANKAKQQPVGAQLQIPQAEAAGSTGAPQTLADFVAQEEAKKAKIKDIQDILYGKDYAGLSQDKKTQMVLGKGYTQQDITDANMDEIKGMSTDTKANYIVSQGASNFDPTALYKSGVLTDAVAKALENKGFIPSSDELMAKVESTDAYKQRKAYEAYTKEVNKLKVSQITKQGKLKIDTQTKLLELNNKTVTSMLKGSGRKKPKAVGLKPLTSTKKVKKVNTTYKLSKIKLPKL